MDGAKRKSISAPELYAAIDTAEAPLVVDAKRAPAPDAGPPMIIGAVRCPAHYIAAWHRDRRKGQSVVGDFASRPKEVNPMLHQKRKGFGWERWSRQWLYDTLGPFNGYRVRRDRPKVAPAG
jgi:hypothetical protein